jgi:hypothetical protein
MQRQDAESHVLLIITTLLISGKLTRTKEKKKHPHHCWVFGIALADIPQESQMIPSSTGTGWHPFLVKQ